MEEVGVRLRCVVLDTLSLSCDRKPTTEREVVFECVYTHAQIRTATNHAPSLSVFLGLKTTTD